MQDRATWHDFSQGPVQQTGNPLDVAIDGNAFLVVQTPRGERYTRNGALQINAHGQLVTTDGIAVLGDSGPIVFQATDRDIVISHRRHDHGARGPEPQRRLARGKLRLVALRPSRSSCGRTAPALSARRTACTPQPVAERRASSRARSRSPTCAA